MALFAGVMKIYGKSPGSLSEEQILDVGVD